MPSITIIVNPLGCDMWEARLEGQKHVLCKSRAVFIAAARALAEAVHANNQSLGSGGAGVPMPAPPTV